MKILSAVLISLCAINVMANDSASPMITVQGIDPMGMTSGQQFKVYGKNTVELFEMIPAIKSVMPDQDIITARRYRTVDIESNGWQLNITCEKGGDALHGSQCTFSLNRKGADWEQWGDTYEWAPACSAAQ